MNRLEQELQQERKKVEYYSSQVTPLLKKHQYNNFLNMYLQLLYHHLIKYQTLHQALIESKTTHAEENLEEDKENEKK